ncbi:MAG: M4 family metallopeptidase [Actinomycetota bacterium]|nr:M4 family metallopeptidase [Actinomycetota bacterium]
MRRSRLALALAFVFTASAVIPAAARPPALKIVRDRGTRAPVFVTDLARTPLKVSPAAAARVILQHEMFAVDAPERELRVVAVERDDRLVTVRFAQRFEGRPVWGAQYLVHLRDTHDGLVGTSVNGHFFTELNAPTAPVLDLATARRLVRLRSSTIAGAELEPHGLTVLPFGTGILAYHFTVWGTRWGRPVKEQVFLNARTGAVAFSYNDLRTDQPVSGTGITAAGREVQLNLFGRGSIFEMRDRTRPMFESNGGEITTHDVTGLPSYVATEANIATSESARLGRHHTETGAVDAHFGAQEVYEFYLALGRNSLDDRGGDIISSVNATENGKPMFNAFWDGRQVVYGNPDPSRMFPMSADLDVVAHELTHGVTQHSGNLAYVNQSGAMNEAYSDYFGEAVDVTVSGTPMSSSRAGEIGEDLCREVIPSRFTCPLRDLNDGMTTEDFVFYLTDFDSGGVHLNSTIYGGALWDIREALGDRADRYIYKALVSYTTPLDDFVDGRNAVVAAARELEAPAADIEAIENAFTAKGIVPGWDSVGENDAQILMDDVAPVGTHFSPPQVSGSRFVIGDYEDQTQICCEPLQLFVGRVDGSEAPVKFGEDEDPDTYNDESPDISGDRVVWSHTTLDQTHGFDSDIHTRILGGPVRTVVDAPGFQLTPVVEGRLVAWEDGRGARPHVWARRIGGRARRVSPKIGRQSMPQVSGDTIAWWHHGGPTSLPRIGLKNLRTGRSVTIRGRNSRTWIGPPAVTDRHVYWYQDTNFDAVGAIMRANLNGRKRKAIVPEGADFAPVWFAVSPAPPLISFAGSFVSYHDEFGYVYDRFANDPEFPNEEVGRDVWVVPASGGGPVRITSNIGDQAYPQMAEGNRVLWLDSSRARTDLMTRVLP